MSESEFNFNLDGNTSSGEDKKENTDFTFGEGGDSGSGGDTEFNFTVDSKKDGGKKEEGGDFNWSEKKEDNKDSGDLSFNFGEDKKDEKDKGGATSGGGDFDFNLGKEEKDEKKDEGKKGGDFDFNLGSEDKKEDKKEEKKEDKSSGSEFDFGGGTDKNEKGGDKKEGEKKDSFDFSIGGDETGKGKYDPNLEKDSKLFSNQVDDYRKKIQEFLAENKDAITKIKTKTVEQILNDWNQELEHDVSKFNKLAIKVSKWDQRLIDNETKIIDLYNSIREVGEQQHELSSTLDMIESQQSDMEKTLDSIEDNVNKHYGKTRLSKPDRERAETYGLAQDTDAKLNEMTGHLQDMIKKLNTSYENTIDPNNEFNNVVQILSSHLHSLQWVDTKSEELKNEIQRISSYLKK